MPCWPCCQKPRVLQSHFSRGTNPANGGGTANSALWQLITNRAWIHCHEVAPARGWEEHPVIYSEGNPKYDPDEPDWSTRFADWTARNIWNVDEYDFEGSPQFTFREPTDEQLSSESFLDSMDCIITGNDQISFGHVHEGQLRCGDPVFLQRISVDHVMSLRGYVERGGRIIVRTSPGMACNNTSGTCANIYDQMIEAFNEFFGNLGSAIRLKPASRESCQPGSTQYCVAPCVTDPSPKAGIYLTNNEGPIYNRFGSNYYSAYEPATGNVRDVYGSVAAEILDCEDDLADVPGEIPSCFEAPRMQMEPLGDGWVLAADTFNGAGGPAGNGHAMTWDGKQYSDGYFAWLICAFAAYRTNDLING